MEGSYLFIDNYSNTTHSKDDYILDNVNLDLPDLNKSIIKVYHGSIDADNALLEFVDRSKRKIDSCISSTGPSVIIEVDKIKQKRIHAVKERGLKLRYVTEITKDNIDYIKEMMQFSEIRHMEGIKGNFEVSDEKEYVAVATLKESQSLPKLLLSNIAEMVEQQQFVFDSFWNRAIPAEQIIKEIEQGVVRSTITILSDYRESERKEFEMITRAEKEIQIIYSTSNAFHVQEKGGTLQLLKEMTNKNKDLRVSILLPIDSSINKSLSFSLLNKNIVFQDIAPSINIKIKSLVVDRKESLIVELKHTRAEKHTASVGFSIYSNSESIVLSYSSIFEVLYNQSILYGQIKEDESIKNEFINIAAHELRTPIMPILNGMEILEEKLGDKEVEKYKREIDIITRNAARLHNLAESILHISRIESGTFSLNIQKKVDIRLLILNVIEDIEKKYVYTDKAKKIAIKFNLCYNKDIIEGGEEGQEKEQVEGVGQGQQQQQQQEGQQIEEEKESEQQKKDRIVKIKNSVFETDRIYKNDNDEKETEYKPSLYVDCDPQKISQVVFNLLDNAIKFTTEGLIYVSTNIEINTKDQYKKKISLDNNNDAAIAASNENENKNESKNKEANNNDFNGNVNGDRNGNGNKSKYNLIVTVEDTGIGINKDIKDQLFEKFSSRSTHGTGLGLYLSKKIIEAHGGKIWYESPNDKTSSTSRLYKDDCSENNNNIKNQNIVSIFRFSLPIF